MGLRNTILNPVFMLQMASTAKQLTSLCTTQSIGPDYKQCQLRPILAHLNGSLHSSDSDRLMTRTSLLTSGDANGGQKSIQVCSGILFKRSELIAPPQPMARHLRTFGAASVGCVGNRLGQTGRALFLFNPVVQCGVGDVTPAERARESAFPEFQICLSSFRIK